MECKCETCARNDCSERTKQDDLRIVIQCDDFVKHNPTNADRIRAMSDEELAVLLADEIPHGDCCNCNLECHTQFGDEFKDPCHNAFYRWLKQPVEDK